MPSQKKKEKNLMKSISVIILGKIYLSQELSIQNVSLFACLFDLRQGVLISLPPVLGLGACVTVAYL